MFYPNMCRILHINNQFIMVLQTFWMWCHTRWLWQRWTTVVHGRTFWCLLCEFTLFHSNLYTFNCVLSYCDFFKLHVNFFCTDLSVLPFVSEVFWCCNREGQTGCENVSGYIIQLCNSILKWTIIVVYF